MISRPEKFEQVLKQTSIKKELQGVLCTRKWFHAYLFNGFKGTGKTTLARIFAKAVNCENLTPQFDACFECKSCTNPIDIIEIDGGVFKTVCKIESLIEKLKTGPLFSEKKILLLDEAHKISPDSFTALLKFIEEPPKHIMVIFITNQKNLLPKTILSRFRIFETEVFNKNDIEQLIQPYFAEKNICISHKDLIRYLMRFSEGSPREIKIFIENSVKLNEKEINFETEVNFNQCIKLFLNKENSIYLFFQDLISRDCNSKNFLLGLSFFIFDNMNFEYFELAYKIEYIISTYNYLSGYAILSLLLKDNNGFLYQN